MNKARLIKKTELIERGQPAPSAQQTSTSRQSVAAVTQRTLTQWVGTYRNARRTDPRVAFAALFTAGA